jgi:CheY-like chemotaxis protein
VDDNRHAAESLAMIVGIWGHETRVSFSGNLAVGLAETFLPDVVLLDLGLPIMDGYEVARALRNHGQLRGTTLVAMTGFSRDEVRERAHEAGFDEHMVKPIDFEVLERIFRELADRGEPST